MDENNIGIAQVTAPTRFQITVDGNLAGFAQFVDEGEERILFHTVIREEFGGQGLAGKLVSAALDQTRSDGKRVVPLCPFVKGYIEKHPEYADLAVKPTQAHVDLARTQPQA